MTHREPRRGAPVRVAVDLPACARLLGAKLGPAHARCWTQSCRWPTSRGNRPDRLGTATVCAPFTAPALLAKAMTSLDVLSSGRLTVGLGIGWLPEEYAAAGVPFERRGAGWTSTCAAWTRCGRRTPSSSPASSTQCRARTGPATRAAAQPPVLLGGAAAPALRRAGRLAEGWIASRTTSEISGRRSGPCARAREAGRNRTRFGSSSPSPGATGSRGAAQQGGRRSCWIWVSRLRVTSVRGAHARRFGPCERLDVARPPAVDRRAESGTAAPDAPAARWADRRLSWNGAR